MKDYVTVAERIGAFYAENPTGSLQSELIELSDSRVVIRGLAYRTPEDIRPGVGTASMHIPGRTPFTIGSEVENTETSAWGRAIAALGFEVKRGIATTEDVAAKSGPVGAVVAEEAKPRATRTRRASPEAVAAMMQPVIGQTEAFELASKAKKDLAWAKSHEAGLTEQQFKALAGFLTKKEHSAEWTTTEVDQIVAFIASPGVEMFKNATFPEPEVAA